MSAGGLLRPGEESIPLQGKELLGVSASHGPSREFYTPSRKSRVWPAEAPGPPAAGCRQGAAMSVERMRAAFSSPAGAPAVLQPGLPGGGAAMVTLEGTATLPGEGGEQTETERPKPALPGAGQKPETARARGRSGGAEGNHYRTFFSTNAATGRAATRDSVDRREVPYSTSVRRRAGTRWSASGSGNSAGGRRAI